MSRHHERPWNLAEVLSRDSPSATGSSWGQIRHASRVYISYQTDVETSLAPRPVKGTQHPLGLSPFPTPYKEVHERYRIQNKVEGVDSKGSRRGRILLCSTDMKLYLLWSLCLLVLLVDRTFGSPYFDEGEFSN